MIPALFARSHREQTPRQNLAGVRGARAANLEARTAPGCARDAPRSKSQCPGQAPRASAIPRGLFGPYLYDDFLKRFVSLKEVL